MSAQPPACKRGSTSLTAQCTRPAGSGGVRPGDPGRRVLLNPHQKLDEHKMTGVVPGTLDARCVRTIAIAFGIDRHSTNIDFDAAEPLDFRWRICQGLNDAGVAWFDSIVNDGARPPQRCKVHCTNQDSAQDTIANGIWLQASSTRRGFGVPRSPKMLQKPTNRSRGCSRIPTGGMPGETLKI